MQRIKSYPGFLMAVFFLFCFVPSSFGATVDVLVVYDTTAKSWVDSHAGMSTFAANAIAKMNQATANSGVDLTFRLAYTAAVPYTYSGDSSLNNDLDFLQAGTGNLSSVHTWRNTYGADIVVMLVDTGSDYGTVGLGYTLSAPLRSGSPNYAFSVCAIQSVYDSETMTHEVGHNFGCDHAKAMLPVSDRGPGIYSYSAGWYFTGTDSTKYCTIMAYNSDGYGNVYLEAPYFSSPLVSYHGTYTGDATNGDNARTLRETMDVVAAYRTESTTTTTTITTTTTTSALDTTTTIIITGAPNRFTFTDEIGVALNTVLTSNEITVSGITSAVPISITGGTYSINGGSYTNANGTVNNGDKVTVQQTSSESYSTKTDATLNIGGITDTFSVTTKDAPAAVSGDSGGGGGGCFIATAAFGSELAGQVEILRQFRDRYLLTNAAGKKFVAWYYRNGPVAASWIKDKPMAKAAVRVALYPLIGFSLLLISGYLPSVMAVLLLSALCYLRFRPKELSGI
jgi:hypothetical protein